MTTTYAELAAENEQLRADLANTRSRLEHCRGFADAAWGITEHCRDRILKLDRTRRGRRRVSDSTRRLVADLNRYTGDALDAADGQRTFDPVGDNQWAPYYRMLSRGEEPYVP